MMIANRKQLHDLIDAVDASEFNILYHLLIKFIPEDVPAADETEAIHIGREEFARGEFVRHEDINWN
jgi:predicted transcriptional regulator